MKIIEAMKKIQDLHRKAEDLRKKVGDHCADMDYETPVYPDQRSKVDGWLQAHADIMKEILALKLAIQKTNIATQVDIELNGKSVSRSIAEWIHRRRELAKLDFSCWNQLGDKGLREGTITQSNGEAKDVKLRRYFDANKRDEMKEMYASEPSTIDGRLEVVNAVTDLVS